MKAQPATKTSEIQDKLVPYLNENRDLSELEFKRYEREIQSIPDDVEKYETLGLLYAIQKNDMLMEKHFEYALSLNFDLITVLHYSIVLNRRSLFKKWKNLLCEYKSDLNTFGLLIHFIHVALIYVDYDMAEFAIEKAVKIKCDEDHMNNFYLAKHKISKIKSMTNISDVQMNLLVDICSNILRKYKLISSSISLETIAGGHYVFGVNTHDIDTLVDMNFELADRVSENPELDSCKLIAVFRPNIKVES